MIEKIFFSGIGGSGLSSIACFQADRGAIISGSDRAFDQGTNHPLHKIFEAKKIMIFPQDGSGVHSGLDLFVFSTAVEPDQSDRVRAKALGIPSMSRPQYLTHLIASFTTIAVAGTSGKSTTAGLLTYLMAQLGMDPNFIGGGRVKAFHTDTNPGNTRGGLSDLMVVEACESDGSLVDYRPSYSIITNLALDHHSVKETATLFKTLYKNTKNFVIACGDNENLNHYVFDKSNNIIRFSIEQESEYMAQNISYQPLKTTFTVKDVPFELRVPGKHNLYNALSCISLLSEMGVSIEAIASVLPGFSGIERRFDIRFHKSSRLVIDDYAHNPHKIQYLMKTMQTLSDSVCYIFQPHGFAPVRLMKEDYINTFKGELREGDSLFILPIFYQGGTAVKDISSRDLAIPLQELGFRTELIEKRAEIFNHLKDCSVVVIFGARDESLSLLADEIAEWLDK